MLGSSNSIACAKIMLNAAVAESLRIYADRLEGAENFEEALHDVIKQTIADHKRIIFNGNGYDDAWIREATQKRGLLNYRTTPDCIPHLLDEKNVQMLISHKVFKESELRSRCEILLENYCKTVIIEANTMVDMARKQIVPAVERYAADVAGAASVRASLVPEVSCGYEKKLVKKLSGLMEQMDGRIDELAEAVRQLHDLSSVEEESCAIRDSVIPKMNELRAVADEAESVTADDYWPFPTYGELLFGVR